MPEKTFEITGIKENDKMKDGNGSGFKSDAIDSKLIQDQTQKSQKANNIRCAEIKTIPSVGNGYGDRQRNVFKVGEYNRATASFEMNSSPPPPTDRGGSVDDPPESTQQNAKLEFDLSSELSPSHYFKSSFARSMVVNSCNKSKSLDYTTLRRNGYSREDSKDHSAQRDSPPWQIPGKENWDLRKAQPAEVRDDLSSSGGSIVSEHQQRNKKVDVIEEHLRNNQTLLLDRPGSRASSSYQRSGSSYSDRRFDDVLYRSPLTASCRSSYHRSYSSASDVDTVLLQSQVTTLQWQLRQAEASRQMHRAVLEQVVSFLQRTHKNLDQLQSRLADGDAAKVVNRVPRSRSVHGVDATSSRSESNLSFQKAKSVAQIADPYCPKHGTAYRDMTWRRPGKQEFDPDEVTPSKLSEEAFRLLRTVQSLLNTREPDLSSRLSNGPTAMCSSPGNPAEVSSTSSTMSAALDSDNSDNFQQSQETLRNRTPVQDHFLDDSRRAASSQGVAPRSSRARIQHHRHSYNDEKNSPPQLSISSADDESGFSSLNSFQEIGLPLSGSAFNKSCTYYTAGKNVHHADDGLSLQEVGLPRVDDVACKVHRRWSSTPADNHAAAKIRSPPLTNGEVLRVLWV